MYEGYALAGTSLSDDDIDVLEIALDDLLNLSNSAPNVLSDIDGAGFLKQSKATLQLNRAKKALAYSIKTAKKLLSENKRSEDSDEESESETSTEGNSENTPQGESTSDQNETEETAVATNVSENLEIYSKFDFVPGDKLLYFDDFSQDFIGDFPSKWNTNGTGEVVKVNNVEGNWFEVKSGYNIFYIPLLDEALPEEYTIEFDVLTSGLDRQTSSTAVMQVIVDDNDGFGKGTDLVQVSIPFCQYAAIDVNIQNKKNGKREIYSNLGADLRDAVLNQPHVSIAVNKQRFRMWVNERKYVDVPRLVPEKKLQFIKFALIQLKDGKDRVFIRNLKVAEGGVDLRRKLMSEGRISTNGILFDSGSATIQPQSYGIIRQISQVLVQDTSIKLNIIGHTDADGADDANLKLSKARADAVKTALITIYKISGDRLQTDGKGETQPVGDNSTSDGKAQNRRVEFVKI
ncbi:MAG: OmpA family protein, partial [Bacteroidia bacterium]|nr:OmpA family protein [Bacteroidia bacterium]